MPQKIRELIAALRKAGFHEESAKGSHKKYSHPKLKRKVTISGNLGQGAHPYQEAQVNEALKEVGR